MSENNIERAAEWALDYGCQHYASEGRQLHAATVSWDRNLRTREPQVDVNWSCYGAVSVAEAERFVVVLQQAIADAKAKAAELGIAPEAQKGGPQ